MMTSRNSPSSAPKAPALNVAELDVAELKVAELDAAEFDVPEFDGGAVLTQTYPCSCAGSG